MFWPFLMSRLDFGPGALIVVVPIRSCAGSVTCIKEGEETLICRAIVKKACSTFVAFLADVSRNGIPRPSANSYPSVLNVWRDGNLCNGVFDDFFIAHIGLVSHEKFIDSLGGITINLLKPLFDIVE